MPFKPSSFMLVTMDEVLGYCQNEQQVIHEAHRVLSVNGLLVVGEKKKHYLRVKSYNCQRITSLLRNNHFKILKVKLVGYFLPRTIHYLVFSVVPMGVAGFLGEVMPEKLRGKIRVVAEKQGSLH